MAVPPDFVAGQVLTAAQMNAVGLWLIKTQTIGTTVSSVVVNDAFSADYQNYKVIVAGGTSTNAGTLAMTLGSTATGYYFAGYGFLFGSGVVSTSGANANSMPVGTMRTDGLNVNTDIFRPFEAGRTSWQGSYIANSTTGFWLGIGGILNNGTSYTSFTITPDAGTLTGGTIYVYGYRD